MVGLGLGPNSAEDPLSEFGQITTDQNPMFFNINQEAELDDLPRIVLGRAMAHS